MARPVPGGGVKLFTGPAKTQVNYAKRALQGFNMRFWLSNQMTLGRQAWDGAVQNQISPYGLEYPYGSGIEHLYGAGLWIGALVNGARHVSEGYNGDYAEKYIRPDPRHPLRDRIWNTSLKDSLTEPNRRGMDDDGDGLTDEDELDGLDNDGDWVLASDDIGSDGVPDSLEVGCKGGYDAVINPDPANDNYDRTVVDSCHTDANGNYRRKDDPDLYTELNGIPDHGEPHVDEDYGAMSDNDLYCTARDDNDPPAGHFPIGAEVTQKSYAWQTGTSAEALSILQYRIRNVSTTTWKDVYLAFFADVDVGPVNGGDYWNRNYSCFADSVKTAFVDNPVDPHTTPLGVAMLGTDKPLDELKFVYKWFNFSSYPSPGTVDSVLYAWMSGEPFPDDLIMSCGSPAGLSDVRFLISAGPFDSTAPGEEITIAFALVSGENVENMLTIAGRARRIYDADGFISPFARIEDADSASVTLGWTAAQSPFGQITSYRVLYGTTPGDYTDSLETTELSLSLSGLDDSLIYYISIVAFDDQGNRSAPEELSTLPGPPRNLVVAGEQRSISLRWKRSTGPNLLGYNIYRRSEQDSSSVRVNALPVADTAYADTTVDGTMMYFYHVTAVSVPGFESSATPEFGGRLIPPAVPRLFVAGPGPDFVRLEWEDNTEDDLAGYNVYRTGGGESVLLNTELLPVPGFTDSTVVQGVGYSYVVESVDSTGATASTNPVDGHTVTPDQGVLALLFPCGSVEFNESSPYVGSLLSGYQDTVVDPTFVNVYNVSRVYYLARYSSVLWIDACETRPYSNNDPLALRGYIAGGGHVLIIGQGITPRGYPYQYRFLSDIFGITPLLGIDTTSDLAGVSGSSGFPSVSIDPARITPGKRPNLVETFPEIPPERVVYSYLSNPPDSNRDGKPVGIRSIREDRPSYYFSFPLLYMDSSEAKAMLRQVLTEFGEVLLDVSTGIGEIPASFRLYEAFPNPFNPSTTVRFDVPVRSRVRLSLYDVLGRELEPLLDEDLSPGTHEIRWDASGMASGMYYVRLRARPAAGGEVGVSDIRKLLLVK